MPIIPLVRARCARREAVSFLHESTLGQLLRDSYRIRFSPERGRFPQVLPCFSTGLAVTSSHLYEVCGKPARLILPLDNHGFGGK
jgi:hypothetical protein